MEHNKGIEAEEEKGRGGVTMCDVAQALEDLGVEKERIRVIRRMLLKGYSKKSILELNFTQKEYAKAKKCN